MGVFMAQEMAAVLLKITMDGGGYHRDINGNTFFAYYTLALYITDLCYPLSVGDRP